MKIVTALTYDEWYMAVNFTPSCHAADDEWGKLK